MAIENMTPEERKARAKAKLTQMAEEAGHMNLREKLAAKLAKEVTDYNDARSSEFDKFKARLATMKEEHEKLVCRCESLAAQPGLEPLLESKRVKMDVDRLAHDICLAANHAPIGHVYPYNGDWGHFLNAINKVAAKALVKSQPREDDTREYLVAWAAAVGAVVADLQAHPRP